MDIMWQDTTNMGLCDASSVEAGGICLNPGQIITILVWNHLCTTNITDTMASKVDTYNSVETGYRYNNVGIEMYMIDKVVVYNVWVCYTQLLQCTLQCIHIVAVDGSAGILCIQTVQCAGRLVQVMCLLEYFNNHINH